MSAAARVIAYALDGTLRRAAQSQRARTLRVGPRRPTLTPLGYGLFLHDGEAVLGRRRVAEHRPHPRAASGARRRAQRRPARPGHPEQPRSWPRRPCRPPGPPDALALFADLLAAGPGLVAVWEGLDLVGIVERWIPQWATVRCRPQRNAVHRHTVDRHSVETVVRASGLVRDVQRPDLLLLAALLHDIGKAQGTRRPPSVRSTCRRRGLRPAGGRAGRP